MKPKLARALVPAVLFAAASSVASAQIGWVEYLEDNGRMSSDAALGLSDSQEKDYAWGDLDKDGWTDLVVVRKQPFTTSGRRVNVLFMNESGTLTDRTAQYASASDVGSDNGFMTMTNDRDVDIADVNLDGWDDVITATTISPGQPKHRSHPRVYINLGEDVNGDWLGLRFENFRTPDFGTFPNFCAVAVGDVTGDGYPDLYFAHYHQSADVDLDDRLWINDGTGVFVDESTARMTAQMRESSFGVAAIIADMNGDGVNDIVKDTALGQTGGDGPRVVVDYNNPTNEGFFNILQEVYEAAPYHANVGDLNKDGKLDIVISDDGSDRYVLNQGNDGLGRVIWSQPFTYQVNDDGFGSNNLVADLDGDEWGDVLITDVDVDIPGCGRRMHIYHNAGGQVGGNVTLREESSGNWRGVQGMRASDLSGAHDVAVFDIDNDGDQDMVLGRCSSTSIWLNQLDPVPPDDIGKSFCAPAATNSTGLSGELRGLGSRVVADNAVALSGRQLPTGEMAVLLVSDSRGGAALAGGGRIGLCIGAPFASFKPVGVTNGAGEVSFSIDLTAIPTIDGPVAAQPGEKWFFQLSYRDGGAALSTDGLSIRFQ